MTEPKIAPYGSWRSQLSSDHIASGVTTLGQIALDGDDVYWLELRPSEDGRSTILRRTPDGRIQETTPAPYNVRSRVHEYGGGAFAVSDGAVFFSNFLDQRIYRRDRDGLILPVSPEGTRRYADGVIDRQRGLMICVCEEHPDGGSEARNFIAKIGLEGQDSSDSVLVSGEDFYSSPRLSPDGMRLAWISWRHPNMPWDASELWVAELDDRGRIANQLRVAGGPDESVLQPEWSSAGVLHFISDRSGWWNLYQIDNDGMAVPLIEMEADFARAPWTFGGSSYSFISAERIICSFVRSGTWTLALLDLKSGAFDEIATEYTEISYLRSGPKRAFFVAGSSFKPPSIVALDLSTQGSKELRSAFSLPMEPDSISAPQAIEYPTGQGIHSYAFFYAPKSRDFMGPEEERPPLIVIAHGGPTSTTSTALNPFIQFWTSRGIAVLDVNYRGSTGYGRSYRRSLLGRWGLDDVEDCINGAMNLVERGIVDEERLAIRGGSAGGFTTLSALTFHTTFRAGASYYGISDLEVLAKETHKFESRYTDQLIGPYPERRDLYLERSPLHFADRLNAPVIFFQGLEDKIVPPNQAQMMFEALRSRGIAVALVTFAGEQHGFRRQENIKRALEAELYFYSRIFGFQTADGIEPVNIENLEG